MSNPFASNPFADDIDEASSPPKPTVKPGQNGTAAKSIRYADNPASNQSIKQSNNQTNSRSIKPSTSPPVKQFVDHSSDNLSINHTNSRSSSSASDQFITPRTPGSGRMINQSNNQSNNEAKSQPPSPLPQSGTLSRGQSNNQTNKLSNSQPIDRSASQSSSQSIKQSNNQSVSQTISQSISPPSSPLLQANLSRQSTGSSVGSINLSNYQSNNHSNNQSKSNSLSNTYFVDHSIKDILIEERNEEIAKLKAELSSLNELIKQSNSPSNNPSINQTIDQSNDPSINQSKTPIEKVDEEFETIKQSIIQSINQIDREMTVYAMLTDIVHTVEKESVDQSINQSIKKRDDLINQSIKQSNDWQVLAPELYHSISVLKDRIQSINQSNNQTIKQLEELSIKLLDFETKEKHLFHLTKQKTLAQDLTLLSHQSINQSNSQSNNHTIKQSIAINQLVSFLTPVELINCLLVCHRWRLHLDRGSIWKICTLLTFRRILAERREFKRITQTINQSINQHDDGLVTHNPSNIQIAFSINQFGQKLKAPLSKTDVLKYALHVQQSSNQSINQPIVPSKDSKESKEIKQDVINQFSSLSSVMSAFEEASLSQQSAANDKHISRNELNNIRDSVGRKRVMMASMDDMQNVFVSRRSELVAQIAKLEESIKEEIQCRSLLKSEHQQYVKEVEQRSQRIKQKEEYKFVPKQSSKDERIQGEEKTLRQHVGELEYEKRELQRECEVLKMRIEQANKQRAEADQQIALLRGRARQVGW